MHRLIDPSATDPADHAAREDAWAAALRGMTERQRVTMALHCRHGMTFEEIAPVLGLSGWAIGKLFKEAVEHLRSTGKYLALCSN